MKSTNFPDFAELAEALPAMIPAQKLASHLGDVYTNKYFSNLRWMGKPPRSYKLGRKVIYLKDDIISWLKQEIRVFNPNDVAA